MWIICDQGHAINLDHFTRLDWKKVEGENATHYEVLAVRDFRHLGTVYRWDDRTKATVPDIAFQTFRICNRMTEKDAKATIEQIFTTADGDVVATKVGVSMAGDACGENRKVSQARNGLTK